MAENGTATARAVIITGASTGIGEACALRLDRQGWQVLAGVRKQAGGDIEFGEAREVELKDLGMQQVFQVDWNS